MKTLKILTTSLLAAALLTGSAFAADFTPSAQEKPAEIASLGKTEDGKEIGAQITDEEGNVVGNFSLDDIVITAVSAVSDPAASDLPAEVVENLTKAKETLAEKELNEVVEDFDAIWEEATEGAPVEQATVAHVFDVTIDTSNVPEGASISFAVKNPGIPTDTKFVILHNYATDKWEVVPYELLPNGDIKITAKSLSPFVIVVDNGNAPDKGDVESPKTYNDETAVESVNYLPMLLIVAVAGVGAAFAVKAYRREA